LGNGLSVWRSQVFLRWRPDEFQAEKEDAMKKSPLMVLLLVAAIVVVMVVMCRITSPVEIFPMPVAADNAPAALQATRVPTPTPAPTPSPVPVPTPVLVSYALPVIEVDQQVNQILNFSSSDAGETRFVISALAWNGWPTKWLEVTLSPEGDSVREIAPGGDFAPLPQRGVNLYEETWIERISGQLEGIVPMPLEPRELRCEIGDFVGTYFFGTVELFAFERTAHGQTDVVLLDPAGRSWEASPEQIAELTRPQGRVPFAFETTHAERRLFGDGTLFDDMSEFICRPTWGLPAFEIPYMGA
jgi:hypothetical protein